MRKMIEAVVCDLCGATKNVEQINYPVIFTTEQNEGRPVEPYISDEKIDLCDKCMKKVLKIKAHGAQGINDYEVMR